MDRLAKRTSSTFTLKLLTFMMFLIFAMTTDAVGVIIPEIIEEFDLSLTQASTFHYSVMIAIAVSGMGLGFLADKFGRKPAIIFGLALFGFACFLFPLGSSFSYFLVLLTMTGLAIGVFKTAALALIGDIAKDSREHTQTMNLAEGFFGIGAIIGPAVVTWLILRGLPWIYLYVIAGALAGLLIVIAWLTQYPSMPVTSSKPTNWKTSLKLAKDPYAFCFSMAIALYVVVEAGIYVWMPTLLADYNGSATWMAAYALTLFFVFRALGRFFGAWLLNYMNWKVGMLFCTAMIFLCFIGSIALGVEAAVYLLPMSGIFMSIVYPTINSKGISCYPTEQHGTVAGVILFFTAVAAALGPLAMGVVGDAMGHVRYGFGFAMVCSGFLFALALWNALRDPAAEKLAEMNALNSATSP